MLSAGGHVDKYQSTLLWIYRTDATTYIHLCVLIPLALGLVSIVPAVPSSGNETDTRERTWGEGASWRRLLVNPLSLLSTVPLLLYNYPPLIVIVSVSDTR